MMNTVICLYCLLAALYDHGRAAYSKIDLEMVAGAHEFMFYHHHTDIDSKIRYREAIVC